MFAAKIFFFLLLTSLSNAAPVTIAPGTYVSQNVTVTIRTTSNPDIVEIRADGKQKTNPDFLTFYLNTSTLRAAKSPYGESAVEYGEQAGVKELSVTDKVFGSFRILHIVGGGFFESSSMDVTLAIDSQSGKLVSMSGKYEIARWGLPNGWHSGPFKTTQANFVCEGLLRKIQDKTLN
jgi:hypothetical protein